MKRKLSGIKPSGEVTLGNYLGAMRGWADGQDGYDNYYFIPDLHALTIRPDRDSLRRNTVEAVAWLLAMGVTPEKSTIYLQSGVPAHAELSWVLSNYVTMGELGRMTQYKDKSRKSGADGQLVGLYTYPVLMAADILLYDPDLIPVGEDQKQHVELTRDIAGRFNKLHPGTFKVPEPVVQKSGSRIMDLADPTKKMSKSDADDSGCILLTDSKASIERKIMRAVTDSGNTIVVGNDKPAITNMLVIYSMITGKSIESISEEYSGSGYGQFKAGLCEVVTQHLEPIQNKFHEIIGSPGRVSNVLSSGSATASLVAGAKLEQVYESIGLYRP
jgi:tryptophanyl-tRNA synthetase